MQEDVFEGKVWQVDLEAEVLGDSLESSNIPLAPLPAIQKADSLHGQQAGGGADPRRGGEALILEIGVDAVAQPYGQQRLGVLAVSHIMPLTRPWRRKRRLPGHPYLRRVYAPFGLSGGKPVFGRADLEGYLRWSPDCVVWESYSYLQFCKARI